MTTINLDGASGYLAKAKSAKGGVLLLPMIYGVNKFVKEFAGHLAEHGLSTLVWDPYPDSKLPNSLDEALALAKELRDGPSLDAMEICVDFLMDELRLDAVGTIGFCLGGRYALILGAREERLGACVSVYPTIESPKRTNQDEDPVVLAAEIKCPTQIVVPGHDHITSNETYHRLMTTLMQREAYTSALVHPAAGHGFMHMQEPENVLAAKRTRPMAASFLEACLT